MPAHNFAPPKGELHYLRVDSKALRGNLLGDPHERTVAVYLAEGVREGEEAPLLVDLTGFTGSGLKHLSWTLFGESVPQRIDRLIHEGKMGPVAAVFPDCFTSLGGNQYIDSAAMGNWAEFLIDEMIPAVEARFPVRKGRAHRGVFGKSSGGYGAIAHGLRYPDAWNAVACHSGDMNFDLCYRADFPKVLDTLAKHGGHVAPFLSELEGKKKISGDDLQVLMALAMAATYDPDPSAPRGVRLPVDPETCELSEERWARWLEHDPLRMVRKPEYRGNLGKLAGLYIDCGSKDQYGLHYGARAFVRELRAAGIDHRYEEFDDNHSSVDYRMDLSLPYLYEALTK
ncbi:MAG: alpha/beta hydrolase-fold protein [Candidatus Eisenbacteria bacterium]